MILIYFIIAHIRDSGDLRKVCWESSFLKRKHPDSITLWDLVKK